MTSNDSISTGYGLSLTDNEGPPITLEWKFPKSTVVIGVSFLAITFLCIVTFCVGCGSESRQEVHRKPQPQRRNVPRQAPVATYLHITSNTIDSTHDASVQVSISRSAEDRNRICTTGDAVDRETHHSTYHDEPPSYESAEERSLNFATRHAVEQETLPTMDDDKPPSYESAECRKLNYTTQHIVEQETHPSTDDDELPSYESALANMRTD